MNNVCSAVASVVMLFVVACDSVLADPPNKEAMEAEKRAMELEREWQKQEHELEKEDRKHYEEMEREERKHQQEMEREEAKHIEEMNRAR